MIATLIRTATTKAKAAALAEKLEAVCSIQRRRLDFPSPDRDDKPEVIEERLPVDAGFEKADLAADEAALA
jgi:hypothetical protein